MFRKGVAALLLLVTALGAIDGFFGGGERLLAIYSFIFPPKADPSFSLGYRALGFRADSYEKVGKAAFQLGAYLDNKNDFPVWYEIESADYSLNGQQNAPDDRPSRSGKVLPHNVQSLDLTPIYAKYEAPTTYDGEALIVVRYGRTKGRLGNTLRIHAALRYQPGAVFGQRFSYAWYPDSAQPTGPVVYL